MTDFRVLKKSILANGKVDGHEVDLLHQILYADGVIDRKEAEFLVDLHKRVERVSPAFEKFFFTAIKQYVLNDGAIDAEEARWLRRIIFADGRVDEREKKLLRELKGEARSICPEFEALFKDCMN